MIWAATKILENYMLMDVGSGFLSPLDKFTKCFFQSQILLPIVRITLLEKIKSKLIWNTSDIL